MATTFLCSSFASATSARAFAASSAADRKARELEQDATARQRRWEELALKAPPAKE